MARLFITERDVNFISDITKEFIKDIVGQKIYYYSVSEIKSRVDLYNESVEKIYEDPIELDALITPPQMMTKINTFGLENESTVTAYVHYRDLVDKGVNVEVGDFFSYGDSMYEILNSNIEKNIFGQVEHKIGIKIDARKARESQFKAKIFGPTDIKYTDEDAIQKKFYQQRGMPENKLGVTNDVRALQETGVLERPIEGQAEISTRGGVNGVSTFYDDERNE